MQFEFITVLIAFRVFNVLSLIVRPQELCVPTGTVEGPCHSCVCNADGLFICHSHSCPNIKINPRKSIKGECQPHVTYRFDELFCTCSYDGKWMSFNCRETFQYLRPKTLMDKRSLRSNMTCTTNALFLIDCNICQCDKSGAIHPSSCTNRLCNDKGHKADVCKFGDFLRTDNEICVCSDVNYYIDRLCTKVNNQMTQTITRNDIASITNVNEIRKNMRSDSCIPHKEYRVDCNRCVCDTKKQLVCTDKICNSEKKALKTVDENVRFYNLPKAKDETSNCEPGQTYRIKCNTCICTYRRRLSCTTMVCLEDFVHDEKAISATLLHNS